LGEVKRAKFLRPVLPGQTVTVKMTAKAWDIFEFTLVTPEGQMHTQIQLQLIPQ